jgi:hypothetical protein
MVRPGLFPNGNPRADYAAHLEPAVVEQLPVMLGRDPGRLTVGQLEAMGHTKQPLLRVIRTNRQRGRGAALRPRCGAAACTGARSGRIGWRATHSIARN